MYVARYPVTIQLLFSKPSKSSVILVRAELTMVTSRFERKNPSKSLLIISRSGRAVLGVVDDTLWWLIRVSIQSGTRFHCQEKVLFAPTPFPEDRP